MKLRFRTGSTYAKRDEVLVEIGFSDYGSYLKSDLWKRIRKAVMRRHCGKCVGCGKGASCVHHTDYFKDTLQGKLLEFLVALCEKCHEKIEFRADGSKCSLCEANTALQRIIDEREQAKQQKQNPPRKRRCRRCGHKLFKTRREAGICKDCEQYLAAKEECKEPPAKKKSLFIPRLKISDKPVVPLYVKEVVVGRMQDLQEARPDAMPGSGPLARFTSRVREGGCARRNQTGSAEVPATLMGFPVRFAKALPGEPTTGGDAVK